MPKSDQRKDARIWTPYLTLADVYRMSLSYSLHACSQMRRLRSDKAELEDRIRDLEARLSEQAVCIREMERRQRVERERADDAEGRLRETDEAVATAASYPIVVPRDGVRARWIFTSAPKVHKNHHLRVLRRYERSTHG